MGPRHKSHFPFEVKFVTNHPTNQRTDRTESVLEVLGALNQEKDLVGAFSVIVKLREGLFPDYGADCIQMIQDS